jgi:hypothetical protein
MLSATTAVVVAAAGWLGCPTPGDPQPEPDPYITVTWMRCDERRSGDLTITGSVPTDIPDLFDLFATAEVAPCRRPRDTDIWAIAAYRAFGRDRVETPAAVWYARMLEGERTIGGTVKIRRGVRAVCLVAESNERLECTRIEWPSATGGPVIGANLRPTALLVRAPAPLPLIPRVECVATVTIACPGCPVCWN